MATVSSRSTRSPAMSRTVAPSVPRGGAEADLRAMPSPWTSRLTAASRLAFFTPPISRKGYQYIENDFTSKGWSQL